jgi:hypothetical protein
MGGAVIDWLPIKGVFDRAAEFERAYHAVPPTPPPCWPRYFLLCHSIELALKAWLMLHGKSAAKLQKKFGHDLEKLFKLAEQCGLQLTRDTQEAIKCLAEAHIKYWARYCPRLGLGIDINADRSTIVERPMLNLVRTTAHSKRCIGSKHEHPRRRASAALPRRKLLPAALAGPGSSFHGMLARILRESRPGVGACRPTRVFAPCTHARRWIAVRDLRRQLARLRGRMEWDRAAAA